MELNGEDKRIRELFCELKREENRTPPLFTKTWNIAEAAFQRTGIRQARFQPSGNLLRFATAILVVSLVLAATVLLPKYLRLRRQPTPDYARRAAAAGPRNSEGPPRPGKVAANREAVKPANRLVATRRVRVKNSAIVLAQQAGPVKQNGLSQWQSPTAKLLHSAGDELLGLVPQLNQSAEDMKKFLANDLN